MNGSHYSSSVVVPLALLTCGTLAASGRHWKTVAGITAIGCTVILSGHTWKGTPQTEIAVTHAGRFFATLPEQSRVGAWNAGIAGWKTGRHVTNLDGLGNASVVDSIKSGRLACYLSEQHIDHLMDWDFMFAPGLMISRNGYDPPGLRRCVSVKATAVKATADDVDAVSWQYRLFAVDGNCVAEMCRRTK